LSYGRALDKILSDLLAQGMPVENIVLQQYPGRTVVIAEGRPIAELTYGGTQSKHPTTALSASP